MAEKKKSKPVKSNKNNNTDVITRESLRYDIIIIVSIAVSIILFIGNLGFAGKVLDTVSRFFFGLIGLISYALPFIIIFFTLFLIANRAKIRSIRSKFIFLLLILLCLCIFFELIRSGGDIENPGVAYLSSFNEKNGGGLLGGLFAFLLFKGFGTAAAFIITIALIILFVLLFIGRSVFSRAEKKTDILKKKLELSKQEKIKRRELEDEKRRIYGPSDDMEKRSERHARGVSLQTGLSGKNEDDTEDSDDMHEVFQSKDSVPPLMPLSERPLRERGASDEMHEVRSCEKSSENAKFSENLESVELEKPVPKEEKKTKKRKK